MLLQRFGIRTGGLRGIMGVGTNRRNKYTVAMATQGLSNYETQTKTKPSVVIAYDSRNNSYYFSEITAKSFRLTDFRFICLIKSLRHRNCRLPSDICNAIRVL